MKELSFKNEKGNVIPQVRTAITEQAMPLIRAALVEKFGEDRVFDNAEGGCFSIAVATDSATRETIFVRLEKTISTKQPDWKPAPKNKAAKSTKKDEVEMAEFDSLFE